MLFLCSEVGRVRRYCLSGGYWSDVQFSGCTFKRDIFDPFIILSFVIDNGSSQNESEDEYFIRKSLVEQDVSTTLGTLKLFRSVITF